MKCRHCNRPKVNRPRGLCWTCYKSRSVREQYPITSPFGRRGDNEPTEAELEQMIAEQLPTMPKE